MNRTAFFISALFTGLASSQAMALNQAKHRDISRSTCEAAGIHSSFCKRVGAEAYNVDYHEFANLSAHAQPDDGQALCEGGNAAAQRLSSLGGEVRAALGMPGGRDRATTLAVALGRTLHTIQDNCAHQGVRNPQHAWLSLADECTGSNSSPDVQPDAVSCAKRETEAIMSALAEQLNSWGVKNEELSRTDGAWTHWPSRGEACEFLVGAKNWNGEDVRWNNGPVAQTFRDHFLKAMWGSAISFDFCSVPADQFNAPNPKPSIDTSSGPLWCTSMSAFCVGKGDAPDELPPWADAAEDAEQAPVEEPSAAEPAQSCSTNAPSSNRSSAPWIALLMLGAILTARRSQPSPLAQLRAPTRETSSPRP